MILHDTLAFKAIHYHSLSVRMLEGRNFDHSTLWVLSLALSALGGPHTTLHTPNSRYSFRDFECCMKCVVVSESVSPRVLNDQIFVCPHTTVYTPNSRYIFQDFKCCMKCVVLDEGDITQSVELPKFCPTNILAKWKSILCKKRK